MVLSDVVNQLHDDDGLADTSTTEQTDLATLGVRRQQVDDLDAGDQDVVGVTHVLQCRRRVVDGQHVLVGDRATLVNRLANDVDDATQRRGANRHLQRASTCPRSQGKKAKERQATSPRHSLPPNHPLPHGDHNVPRR